MLYRGQPSVGSESQCRDSGSEDGKDEKINDASARCEEYGHSRGTTRGVGIYQRNIRHLTITRHATCISTYSIDELVLGCIKPPMN